MVRGELCNTSTVVFCSGNGHLPYVKKEKKERRENEKIVSSNRHYETKMDMEQGS